MKRFWKIFIADTKRIFLGKFPYIFISVILLIAIAFLCCVEFINRDLDLSHQKSFYGIKQYTTLQQLNDNLAIQKESFLQLKEQLETDIEQENITSKERKDRQIQVDTLNRTVMTMQYLSDNDISFERYQDYINIHIVAASDRRSESKNCISLIMVITILISVMTVIRASRIIPGEIKESKSKIMLTLPISRTRYAIYRLLFTFLQSAALIITYSAIIAFMCFIFYGGDDVLIFGTATSVFGLSYIPAVLFILLFSIIQIFVLTIVSFSISLLLQSRLWTMILSLFICFGSELINSIFIPILFNDITKYFLTNNLNPLKAFVDIDADTVYFSLIIFAIHIIPLSLISFFKFAKQDIR